jgi:large repetitive protein
VVLSIAVTGDLTITTKSLPGGQVGVGYSGATLASTGGTAPVTWLVTSGSLPAGLSLNAGTGAITGTPTLPGTTTVAVTGTDSSSPTALTASATLSIAVAGNPLVFPAQLVPEAHLGVAFTEQLEVTGGEAPYTWSVPKSGGKLPTGLAINPSTGVISGTPTGGSGTFIYTASVTDSLHQTASETISLFMAPGSFAPMQLLFPNAMNGDPNF